MDIVKLAYTIDEASKMSGIGRTSLYAEIRSGRLAARKMGRRTVIAHSDLVAFVAQLPNALDTGDIRRAEG